VSVTSPGSTPYVTEGEAELQPATLAGSCAHFGCEAEAAFYRAIVGGKGSGLREYPTSAGLGQPLRFIAAFREALPRGGAVLCNKLVCYLNTSTSQARFFPDRNIFEICHGRAACQTQRLPLIAIPE
jgi:hypothetical protein